MSLTDLKRKHRKQKSDHISVDDFIEDANNYAFGKKTITGENNQTQQTTQEFLRGLDKASTKIYRHATFTLTEKSITQLEELSKTSCMAKSKILRVLIDNIHQLELHEQLLLLTEHKK